MSGTVIQEQSQVPGQGVKEGGDITYKHMVDEPTVDLGESQINKAFAGATVFLTGGTGFLGKLMLDKLLRCCPDIKRIYILARPKKNKEIHKRLEEQFDDVLYEKLRKHQPDFLEKLSMVEGDVGEVGLGIKEEDRMRLIQEVEFIFHGAATVRFDEAIKTAVFINVRGTKEMLLLARACTKLRAMVHVSTAYSNCPKSCIEEKFYDPPLDGDKLIDLVDSLDIDVLNKITPGLLGDYPNTYAFTKQAAEDIVKKYSRGLPVAMFRPAIVIGTAKEPVSGWIDNLYGPTGVAVGAAVGLIRTLNCRKSAIADLVPGDMVVNATIACAWKVARDFPRNYETAPPLELPPPVYNYVSSVKNPLTWDQFMKYTETYGLEIPTVQAIYCYVFFLIQSTTLNKICGFLLHWIPAYIIDGVTFMIGKKPMLRKAYTKIDKFSEVISFFALREWQFTDTNTANLSKELCEADKEIFNFDIATLNWQEYFQFYIRGVRTYLLKDPIDTVPEALIKYRRLQYIHYAVLALLSLLMFKLSSYIFKLIF